MSVKISKPSSAQPYPSDRSLYVGNLANNATVQDLVDIFSQATPVVNARVCIDRITQKPRGYGYVSYATPEEAVLALREFNHINLKGKPIRVMKSFSGKPKEFPLEANLFINNLPRSFTPINLHDSFERFGKILSSKIAFDHQGNSKGFGYIQFENPKDSNEAIINSNEFKFDIEDESNTKKLRVTHYLKPEERNPKFTNVFFRNLPLDFDEEALSKYASEFGEITSLILNPINKSKAKTRTGNVNFKDSDVAIKLVEESKSKNPGEIIALRSIKRSSLKLTTPKHQSSSLEKKETHQRKPKHKPLYSKTTIKVVRDLRSSDDTLGFVTFENAESAAEAIKASLLQEDSWVVRPAINNNRRKSKKDVKPHPTEEKAT